MTTKEIKECALPRHNTFKRFQTMPLHVKPVYSSTQCITKVVCEIFYVLCVRQRSCAKY